MAQFARQLRIVPDYLKSRIPTLDSFQQEPALSFPPPDGIGKLDAQARAAPPPQARLGVLLLARHDAQPAGGDAQVLVDIDLSILGAATERFDEYERQVRFEYAWVAPDAFREGRGRILEQFLARPTIYGTPFFRERLEDQARRNLARSLAQLRSGAHA
jgi:predicted metal-dependent HD superfamily phosphohydrolase